MKLGKFEIYPTTDGFIRLDGGAMFGIVPRVLWEKLFPPDEENRIYMGLNCPLIKTPKHNILIDTGTGPKCDAKIRHMYGIENNPSLRKSLGIHGFSHGDIDIVINSHLHLDHCGGNTTYNDAGNIVPTFSNAKYYIHKGEWEDALNANERTKGSYINDDFLPLWESGNLELVEGDEIEIAEGVSMIRTGGHTQFHCCIKICSEGQTAFYLADLIPTVAHLPYPYIMAYDSFPLETLEQKKRILPQALEENWLLMFEHDPKINMGFLKKEDDKYIIEEAKQKD
ncbi:MAG: MBL fold metallo-hydrolase [Candidatus Brocadiales bacterium]